MRNNIGMNVHDTTIRHRVRQILRHRRNSTLALWKGSKSKKLQITGCRRPATSDLWFHWTCQLDSMKFFAFRINVSFAKPLPVVIWLNVTTVIRNDSKYNAMSLVLQNFFPRDRKQIATMYRMTSSKPSYRHKKHKLEQIPLRIRKSMLIFLR